MTTEIQGTRWTYGCESVFLKKKFYLPPKIKNEAMIFVLLETEVVTLGATSESTFLSQDPLLPILFSTEALYFVTYPVISDLCLTLLELDFL